MRGMTFSQPMMLAWLAGDKSITRRLMNPQPTNSVEEIHGVRCEQGDVERGDGYVDQDARPLKPRYLPGETVYVKETWFAETEKIPSPYRFIWYKADDPSLPISWHSPRFMPAWAARSHALIVSVLPERVQEITETEARAEGCGFSGPGSSTAHWNFEQVWESLHPGSWEKNEWVWRYELSKVRP